MDTLMLKNLTVALPDLMDFTLLEGSVNGADKCLVQFVRLAL